MSFSEWKKYKLVELIIDKPKNGLYKSKEFQNNIDGNRWVKMKEVFSLIELTSQKCELISVNNSEKERFGCIEGDILFGRTSLTLEGIGKSIYVGNINDVPIYESNLFRIRPDQKLVIPKFLSYYFRSTLGINSIQSIANQTAASSIKGTDLSELELTIPRKETQQRIASILSSLDDKIELNWQTNQTLESMAQTVFKEMCLPKDHLLDDGWRMGTISEIGKVITGKTPSSNNPEDFGNYKPFVTPTDFKNYGKIILSAVRHLSNEGVNKLKNKIIPKNSVLVTCIGSDMGKVAINRVECLTNQQINSIITKNSFVDFIYYSLLFKYDLLRNMATGGSTMPMINKSQFEEIKLMIPSNIVLEKFQSVIAPINNQIENNIKETQTLTTLRDSLLPRLMKGEIEI